MSDVAIDRLVLELPGLDAEAAHAVALGVAEGLASAGLTGTHTAVPLVIDPRPGEAPDRLAARIVQSLLQRIG
jgi:hypothetical protein